ncbi:MAG: pyruvate kinase [Planctomycetes bacterium]|jgi:pyruvate kinase|nr:pyruvate kinase [Planctomycetota bacterium]
MSDPELIVTQGPYSTFLEEVAALPAVSGVRLNTVMPVKGGELRAKLEELRDAVAPKILWVDLKARQLRVAEFANTPYTAVTISHRIRVRLPATVYFDNGTLAAKLVEIDGNRLILEGYAGRLLGPGESVNLPEDSLEILEPGLLTDRDREYVDACRAAGLRHYMLSFVESPDDVRALRELHPEAAVMAKIESTKGLRRAEAIAAVSDGLMAARGDLFTEVEMPHHIGAAMKRVLAAAGPKAVAASRLLGSLLKQPSPSCPDVMDLLYLREMGYARFLLGDDLCFKRDLLMKAVRILTAAFRDSDPFSNPTETAR